MSDPAAVASRAAHTYSSTVLALDLGGTRLRAAVVSDGRLVNRRSAPTPLADAQAIIDACLALLRPVRAAAAEAGFVAECLAISAPGPVDARAGTLLDPPNLDRSTWQLPIAQRLGDELALPATLEKDTNVAALGEGYFGAARDVDDFIYLTVSTGVGGAVVTGGRLLRGPDGVAGELGHLAVDAFDGPPCGCGARGHLEAIASGTGIAAAARAADLPYESARDVASAAALGDDRAAQLMARARDAFAVAMVTLVDVFNPSVVVVGGGIATGLGDALLEPARERVAREAFRTQARRARIVPAELGDDVGLVGAFVLGNAALHPDRPSLGLAPRATVPGQSAPAPGESALTFVPATGDDERTALPTSRAVALG